MPHFANCCRAVGRAGLGLAAALGLLAGRAQAQTPDSLAAIGLRLRDYHQQVLVEKLYGHLDRPVYTVRETMWLKLYAVAGASHRPLALSTVAYVEVLNQAQQPVLQTTLALHQATGQGSLVLPATLPSGRYVVRAYTRWMKNFGPEYYFQAPITVLNPTQPSGAGAGAPPPAPPPPPPDFTAGGPHAQGLPGRVAFRVAGAAGRGLAATGTVRDERGQVVATFRTLKFGLGSFAFTPASAGPAYVAEVKLASGATATARLPTVQARGYTLRLQAAGPGQLRLLAASVGTGAAGAVLTLVGHSGGQPTTTQTVYANEQHEASFAVPEQALGAGITHFTLFNGRRQPVCERLYFRRPPALRVAATPAQATYGPRQRVAVQLALPAGTPATNLSLAVYQLDSLAAGAAQPDIATVLSLTSDLRGTVENAGYYLLDSTQTGREATDNLMLTHGWSRFRWDDVLAGRQPALPYSPELNGPLVQARVRTAGGAPAPGIRTYLAWPSQVAHFYSAASNAEGLVQFEAHDFYGPHKVVLQTDWRRDSTYQLELLSPYSARYAASPAPEPLAFSAAQVSALTQRYLQGQVQQAYFGQRQPYHLPPLDTLATYGPPTEQYRLDDYTRFGVMEEVMREYVRGVTVHPQRDGLHYQVVDTPHHDVFREDPLSLLDGVPIFNNRHFTTFDPARVRRIDVITNRYYTGSQSYGGVISYVTYKGDLGGLALNTHALLEDYEGLQGQREFFAPRYEATAQQQSPLADLRNLLYWNPAISTRPGQTQQVEFYTSDQAGRYLVVVQGLAANGLAGSTSASFEVKPSL